MFISRTHFSEVSKAKVTPGGPSPYSISEIFLLRCEIWAPFFPFITTINVLVVIILLLHRYMYFFLARLKLKCSVIFLYKNIFHLFVLNGNSVTCSFGLS